MPQIVLMLVNSQMSSIFQKQAGGHVQVDETEMFEFIYLLVPSLLLWAYFHVQYGD